MWRVKRLEDSTAQALGIVDSSYERVIPFRELEFKNAFLE
jgi:hypothetical protein